MDIDNQSGESGGSKGNLDDSKKSKENRIKIDVEVDIRSLIEKRRNQGKFSELDIEQDNEAQLPVVKAPNTNFEQDGKEVIGLKEEGEGELSRIQENNNNSIEERFEVDKEI